MKKRYIKVYALMVSLIMLLTGCGVSLPDMTEEEEQIIGEYAANLLLKYDANNRSRLVSREEVAAKEVSLTQKEAVVIPEQTQAGMDPVDETTVIEIDPKINTNNTTGSIEEFYELPEGVQIIYQGNEIHSSYTQDGELSDYLAVDAAAGKMLLVLKFRIENCSQADQSIDLLSGSTTIRTTVNGNTDYNVLTTMLMNDMSTYVGIIPAGEGVDVVLLAEVDSDVCNSITTLSIKLKNDSNTCTIQLQ